MRWITPRDLFIVWLGGVMMGAGFATAVIMFFVK